MRANRTGAVLILLVLLAGLAVTATGWSGAVFAADPPITTNVEAGFGGTARAGYWIPVVLEVENQGPDFDGEVRITGSSGYYGNTDESRYVADVVLPRGSHKRITVYVPFLVSVPRLDMELVSEGRTVETFEPGVNIVGEQDLFVGVIGQKVSAWNLLTTLQLPLQGSRVEVVPVDPAEFPERPEVLEAFDIIALSDVPIQTLSAPALEALEGWVAGGGTLVLSGGANGRSNLKGLPEVLLPVVPGGAVQLNSVSALEQLGDQAISASLLPTVTGSSAVSGDILAQEGDIPLAVLGNYGNGRVFFLAFDPAAQPLAGWGGMTKVWENLLFQSLPSSYLSGNSYMIARYPMGSSGQWLQDLSNAVSYLPALELPSVNLLIGIIIGYILLVGPGSYFVLRKLKRPGLAWATIPILVLVFSTSTYFLAVQSKGNDVQVSAAAIVEKMPGTDWARVRQMAGILAPHEGNYDVGVSSDALVGSWDTGARAMAGSSTRTTIRYRGESTEAELMDMGMWTMRNLWSDTMQRYENAVSHDLYIEGDRLKGTVDNAGSSRLQEVWLITGNAAQELGELGPGDTASVDIQLADNPGGLSYVYFQALYQTNPPSDPDEQREWYQRRQMIESAMQSRTTDVPSGVCAFLVYWTEDESPQITINGKKPGTRLLTVHTDPVTPGLRGPFTMPSGMIAASIENIDTSVEGASPGMMLMNGGSLTYRFDVPDGIASLGSMRVQVPLPGSQISAGSIKMLAYNWHNDSWDEMDTKIVNLQSPAGMPAPTVVPAPGVIIKSGVTIYTTTSSSSYYGVTITDALEAELPGPSDYVSASGAVRIRLELPDSVTIHLGIPTLALQGVANG